MSKTSGTDIKALVAKTAAKHHSSPMDELEVSLRTIKFAPRDIVVQLEVRLPFSVIMCNHPFALALSWKF